MTPDQIHVLAVKAPYTHIKVTDASKAIDDAVQKRHEDVFAAFTNDIDAIRKRKDALASLLKRIADWSMHREGENDLCKWIFRGEFMNEIDATLADHVYPFASVAKQSNA